MTEVTRILARYLVQAKPEDVPAAVERARKIEVDVPSILREFGIPAMVERTIAVYRKVLGC